MSKPIEPVATVRVVSHADGGRHLSIVKPVAKQRDYALDNLKGFLIILVILGHGDLLSNFKSPVGDLSLGYIYLFHMPLFFGVSCLFVKEFSWTYFRKRFVQLMIPFFFFVVIDPANVVIQLIHPGHSMMPVLFHPTLKTFVEKALIGSALYLQSALWFLPTLFVANILLSVLLKYRDSNILKLSFVLAFAFVLFFAPAIRHNRNNMDIPYGLQVAIYLLPFLTLLRYIYFNRERFLVYNPLWFVAGLLISSFLVLYFIPKSAVNAESGRFDMAQFYVPDTIWGYIFMTALWLSIFVLFLYFKRSTILSWIGLYTLPIFLLHTSISFGSLQQLPPGVFLPINVIGNVLIGIGVSKLLMKISPRFAWIGMVA